MKANIFNGGANMTAKQIKSEKAECKKVVNEALRDYNTALEGAFRQVQKSADKKSRDVANAAKGKFGGKDCTIADVIAACYPYQTADGTLCRKAKNADGDKVWAEKKLTAAAARGIVRDALKNFIDCMGSPSVTTVTIGAKVD